MKINNTQLSFQVDTAHAGQRLDHVLSILFPQLSLRARRSLWDRYDIFVNGKKARCGHYVSFNDTVNLHLKSITNTHTEHTQITHPIFITNHEDWLFFNKPCGLHSQTITGGAPSLEQWLHEQRGEYGKLYLCNRLDAQTSGIVVAARSMEGVKIWQEMENQGLCQKRYIALVQGVTEQCSIPNKLDTHKRKITKVLDVEATPLRHTHFIPLRELHIYEYEQLCAYFPHFPQNLSTENYNSKNLHLLGCIIHKGARHQIRAHAAKAGFALYNDVRYEENCIPESECFLLHHGSLHMCEKKILCSLPFAEALKENTVIQNFL